MDSSSGTAPSAGRALGCPEPSPPAPSGHWGRQGVILTPISGTYEYPVPKAFPQSPSLAPSGRAGKL